MIIVSQNKEFIINYNNIKAICVTNFYNDENTIKYMITADGYILAKYDTKKEAVDTLNEMSAMIAAGSKDYVME